MHASFTRSSCMVNAATHYRRTSCELVGNQFAYWVSAFIGLRLQILLIECLYAVDNGSRGSVGHVSHCLLWSRDT